METTPKISNAIATGLSNETTLHIYEGTVRSSKTVTAISEWLLKVLDSDEELHLIAGADLDAIRENILVCRFGLLETYGDICSLCKDKVGSYYLQIKCAEVGKPRIKRALLCGYSSADKWEKILGKTIGVILVDEVNIAHKDFIDECFARQVSVNHPLQIWTLNGDRPDHWVYTDYINHATIIGDCPLSIRNDMDKASKTAGWYYQHWTMRDNPIMTDEKIARAENIYPKGSYYYQTKILGERGACGELIYLDYISPELIKPLDVYSYHTYGIGVDIGATRAKNSFCLLGFTADFSQVGVIDKDSFNSCGYLEKTKRLKAFCDKWRELPIEYIAVDSAEQNYISDLKAEFYRDGYPTVIASYKATIKQRIDLDIILLSRGKMQFNDNDGARNVYRAFSCAKWEEKRKGEVREDKNEWLNDVIDSCEYALTRNMKKLLKSAGIYEQD